MASICRALNAEILLLTTPPTLRLAGPKLASVRNLLASAETGGVRLAWEIRTPHNEQNREVLRRLLSDLNIVHCVDISRNEKPIVDSSILYTRLFGPSPHNVYQFLDEELLLVRKVTGGSG